jgi:nitrate reductase / nitrite oxidoreductase, alpha subunit
MPPRRAHRQHRPLGRRVQRLRRPVQGTSRTSVRGGPGGRKAPIVPSIYFLRGRSETMHPDDPLSAERLQGLFCTFANMFVQSPDLNRLHETLDGLDLVVVVDHQMTETVRYADVVLPATTWYEKTDLTATPLHPFLQLQQPAIPAGRRVAQRAVDVARDRAAHRPGARREHFEVTEDEAIEMILAAGADADGPTHGITLDRLREGPVRLNVPDPTSRSLARSNGSSRSRRSPCRPRSRRPPHSFPRGRIEFYKEEERFLELGETVPTFQESARRRRPRPGELAAHPPHTALEVADPLHVREQPVARRDPRRTAQSPHASGGCDGPRHRRATS